MKKIITTILFTALCSGAYAANEFENTAEKVKVAMQAEIRSDKEKDRDKNRMPIETLDFFGLRDDMTIVELIPGGGWYTKLLAPTVAEKGQYYGALFTSRIKNLTKETGFEKIKILAEDSKIYKKEGADFYTLEASTLDVKNVDMVFTFRNYHNFDEQGRRKMNDMAFDALKPGGIYAVVDHTRRHMEQHTPANNRRFDPVLAIKEIQEAGFEFVDFSDLHFREDDELEYEVGARSVTGNTDRWTLKFRKP
ncbi:methyltransferase [Paraglaciecola aquimarina]|uniref:Methyltransferase n=1 Tax=Paraglaciecola algarum TaxID=3050085 RepID=A0ABS9D6C1_9ALTE|nr:methyltransferase [Paraglaciecola sp. G1-23]